MKFFSLVQILQISCEEPSAREEKTPGSGCAWAVSNVSK